MNRWLGILLGCAMALPSWAKSYLTFAENGKVGMKDESGNVVLPPSFEALGWSDGNFSVIGEVTGYRLRGHWGIINLKKEFITEANYESLVYCGGDYIVARKKINTVIIKAGCINLKGETKIPFIYDGISIQGLRAIVFNLKGSGYYYGLTDLDNRILIPLVYKNIQPLGTLRFAVENSENKIALFGDEGKPVTDFSIDSVSLFYRGFAIVYQDHAQGLIDRNGMIKLEAKYNSIKVDEEGKVLAKLPNQWVFINDKNEPIRQLYATQIKPISEGRFIICKGNASGIVDEEFKILVSINYEDISEIDRGLYKAKFHGKTGVITEKEEIIIPFSYDSVVIDANYYRAFNNNLGWQLFNQDGKKLTEKYYNEISTLNQFGFPVVNKGFSGMIDFKGNEFIHCVFDSVARPVDGLLAVRFKGMYGIIDTNENWILAPQKYPLCVINRKRYLQKQPENNFIKSYSGEILYFTPYKIKFSNESFIEYLPDGTEKTISYDGEVIERTNLPENVEVIFNENEGMRGIKKDDRYGFVDDRGRLRIANRYDSIGAFHEGLAAVKLIGKWGFVNVADQIIINPNYDESSYFINGLAIVSRNKKFGLISKTGNILLPLRYDKIKRLANGKFLLSTSNLYGLADEHGNVLVESRFDSLKETQDQILIVCRDKKWGAITDHGLSVIPMIYDRLNYISSRKIFLGEKNSDWKQMEFR